MTSSSHIIHSLPASDCPHIRRQLSFSPLRLSNQPQSLILLTLRAEVCEGSRGSGWRSLQFVFFMQKMAKTPLQFGQHIFSRSTLAVSRTSWPLPPLLRVPAFCFKGSCIRSHRKCSDAVQYAFSYIRCQTAIQMKVAYVYFDGNAILSKYRRKTARNEEITDNLNVNYRAR